MLEAGPDTRGMMGTRAANDPSVFTIMEKAPTAECQYSTVSVQCQYRMSSYLWSQLAISRTAAGLQEEPQPGQQTRHKKYFIAFLTK